MTYALILLTPDLPELIGTFKDLASCMNVASTIDGVCIDLSELLKFNELPSQEATLVTTGVVFWL